MEFLNKLCQYFGLSHEEYLKLTNEPSLDDLPNPFHFQGMERALTVIKEAMAHHEKIMIYGDYDADGVLATSILVKTFALLDYPVGYYIPSRYLDGYGLTEEKVIMAHEKGYKLIITVDNGVSQFAAIAKAYELGMKVIVTDHHSLPSSLPACEVILHPLYSSYGEVVCCGAYVALMLSWALYGKAEDYLLVLAAIATISDMMELRDYNRLIVRIALKILNTQSFYNLSLLLSGNEEIDETTLGLQIAPRINAIGRVLETNQVNRLVRFFVSDNHEEIAELAKWIEAGNEIRKKLTLNAVNSLSFDSNEPALCLICEEKEGLIGLMANRLLQQYNKPVIVFAHGSEKGILKGSARSHHGFSIVKCFTSLKDLLVVYGGHDLAGGCSIKEENFEAFYQGFLDLAIQHPFQEEKKAVIDLSIEEVTLQNYEILRQLAPFGIGWPMPPFALKGLDVKALSYSKSHEHIMSDLSMKSRLVGFNISETSIQDYRYLDIIGHMHLNRYRGNTTLQFIIDEYHGF